MASEPPGCLGFLFFLFGLIDDDDGPATEEFPYRQCDNFLSPAELKFFHVLKQVAGQHFYVCTKVRIADLLYVVNQKKNFGSFLKISQKHVDFVLCDPMTMQPKLAVELDDSSHQTAKAQKRDKLVNSAFAAAKMPVLRVPCRSQYQPEELKNQIRAALNLERPAVETSTVQPPPLVAQLNQSPSLEPSAPQCPKCNVAMVQRTASRGKNKGKRFWACVSYPNCRQIVAID